jgi:hypothetical protein
MIVQWRDSLLSSSSSKMKKKRSGRSLPSGGDGGAVNKNRPRLRLSFDPTTDASPRRSRGPSKMARMRAPGPWSRWSATARAAQSTNDADDGSGADRLRRSAFYSRRPLSPPAGDENWAGSQVAGLQQMRVVEGSARFVLCELT